MVHVENNYSLEKYAASIPFLNCFFHSSNTQIMMHCDQARWCDKYQNSFVWTKCGQKEGNAARHEQSLQSWPKTRRFDIERQFRNHEYSQSKKIVALAFLFRPSNMSKSSLGSLPSDKIGLWLSDVSIYIVHKSYISHTPSYSHIVCSHVYHSSIYSV